MTGLGQEIHYLAPRTIPLRLLCQNMIVRIVSPGAGNRRNHVAIFLLSLCLFSRFADSTRSRTQAGVRSYPCRIPCPQRGVRRVRRGG